MGTPLPLVTTTRKKGQASPMPPKYAQSAVTIPKRSASSSPVVSRIEIEPSANGGFSVRCVKRAKDSKGDFPGYIEPEVYTFESLDGLKGFLDKTFTTKKATAA